MSEFNAEAYLRDCLSVQEHAIEDEFVRLPADLAYWSAQYAAAYERLASAKAHTARVGARIGIMVREDSLKKRTVSEIEQAVLIDLDYQRAQNEEIACEYEKVRLGGIVEAIRTKREMVVSLGAHIRMQMGNDPLIRKEHFGNRVVRQAREDLPPGGDPAHRG